MTLIPATVTLAAGLLPATAAVVLLLLLHQRHPVVRALALPLILAMFGAGVALAQLFGVGDLEFGEALLRSAAAFLLVVLTLRAVTSYMFRVVLQRQWQVAVPPLLPRVSRAVLYIVAALIIVSVEFPDSDLGPLLATSAVTSLVLGLALQPILTNFFAGVVISLERPFRIDDWIQVGDHEGRVTAITWRTTSIRTRQNDTVIFPNANVAQETVVNFLYPHPLHMSRIYVGVHYRTAPHAVRAAMLAAAARVDGILTRPSVDVYVHAFDDSAVTYEMRAWIQDMAALRRIESDVRQEIWEEFRRRDIVIPFPIRTLEIAPRRRARTAPGDMPSARLFVSEGAGQGAVLQLGAEPAVIGRHADCDLRIADPTASHRHARVAWQDNGFVLTDLGSTHGTGVNGEAVTEVVLADFDKIQIGDTTVVVEIDD